MVSVHRRATMPGPFRSSPSTASAGRPTTAVVVPAFNAGRFIGRALASVAAQTSLPERVVVVDDGSNDDTRASAARAFEAFPPGVRTEIVRQDNRGVAAARNRGIRTAREDLVAFLDADDEWLEDHLASLFGVLERFGDVIVAFGDQTVHLERTHRTIPSFVGITRLSDVRGEQHDDVVVLGEDVYRTLVFGNFVPTSAMVVRRRALEAVDAFDERFRTSEDRDLLLRLCRHGRFAYHPQPHAKKYVQHGGNLTDRTHLVRTMQNGFRCVKKHWRDRDATALGAEDMAATRRALETSANEYLYAASHRSFPCFVMAVVEVAPVVPLGVRDLSRFGARSVAASFGLARPEGTP